MIGTSKAELAWVVFWVIVLHLIGPISMLYCILTAYSSSLPRSLLLWAVPETAFYLWMCIYQRYHLQRPAIHPAPRSKEERESLFDHCLDTTQDYDQYISNWFFNKPISTVGRDNVKEFFRWAFLNMDELDPYYDDEVESYVQKIEQRRGKPFLQGKTNVKSLRLTFDKVSALHRSLTWYMCIFVVDSLTHLYLRFYRFGFYRASVTDSLKMLPPRPQAFVASQRSPSRCVSYWYRPHTSKTELPIVFLHGIGVGLYPYMEFLKEINQGRSKEMGDVGILAAEILPISSRFTTTILPKDQMCKEIQSILDQHKLQKVVLLSHSYGSVIATHLLKAPELASRIASVVMVDPISILLNQPDVAYNFTVRRPRYANEWLLWYFGSKDIGIAHTLARTFFWSENVLWKKDLLKHRSVIFLAEKDSIVNAPKVRAYLDNEHITGKNGLIDVSPSEKRETENEIKLVWCQNMDHGQVFDLRLWRAKLKAEVLNEARHVG